MNRIVISFMASVAVSAVALSSDAPPAQPNRYSGYCFGSFEMSLFKR
jgi:hypothetical protein